MPRLNLSAVKREAIWLAHGRKCAYTRQELNVNNFHIDHIIPVSLAKDSTAFNTIKRKYNLPESFNINGFENLLPCHPTVNHQKSDLILEKIYYFLSIAASKKSSIEENIINIERRNDRGKATILLLQYLERGDLTPNQISEILQQYPEDSEPIFELIEGMQFTDTTEVKFIAKADIESLCNRPIRLGRNNHIDSLKLINEKDETVNVRTCREYESALEQGYFPYPNNMIKMSARFNHQCGLLKALQRAITPQYSYISNPRVGVVDLKLLPFSFFPPIDNKSKNTESDATYQDKLNDGVISVSSIGQNSFEIIAPMEMGQQLVEVVRADFDGDGIEDVLLFEYCFATPGTLGYGGVRILTRKSADGKFEILE